MQGPRLERVAEQFQQEIALILQRELKDPRLGFVTITRVELSKDLAHAKVYYSCLGEAADRRQSQEALDHAVRFVHGLIKRRLRLRVIPAIRFCYDDSIAASIAMTETLERLKREEGGGG
jgi:ribosome-binding factor A